MRTQHHIRTSTLLDLAAGRLCAALSEVAASHLAWCRVCRQATETARNHEGPTVAASGALPFDLSSTGQTALQAMDRRPVPAGIADAGISDRGLPMPLALRLDGRSLDDVAWRRVLPGVAVRELALPRSATGHLRLVRIAPGKALPEHGHGSGELSLVLRGAYRDGFGRYAIGDIADLDGAAVHRPVAEGGGPCICLVATESPPTYRSWLGRVWQRLAGL
jgi:putative transcriptional regulator